MKTNVGSIGTLSQWLVAGMLLAGAGVAKGQVAGERVALDAVRAIAGESTPIQWPLRENRISSIVSVRSTPELSFPIRVDLANDGGSLRLTVPPATPPGVYDLQITARVGDGRPFAANLTVTVRAMTVTKSPVGRTPVILLNGFQPFCTDTGSSETDSMGTFGQMWPYLLAESVPVLFFNNCGVGNGDFTIERLASQLSAYISGLVYTDGTPVTQVDLVAHSMGGLIVRAYLAGLQPGDGSFLPPANPRVRKAVFIATPHFGSFQAGIIGAQESEMVLGSQLLWDLATWNQRRDDLRGVDAIAVIGNAGVEGSLNGAADGVVSLSSASLNFAEADQRTRIVPYCHIPPAFVTSFGIGMSCYSPNKGIAYIDNSSHMTFQIMDSFLAGTTNWQAIGHSPSTDTSGYLAQYGGLMFGESSASGTPIALTQSAFGTVSLQGSLSSDGLFYNEFLKGTANFTSTTAGAISCGPFTEPAGFYSAVRCKPGLQISGVGPLLPTSPGLVVASGGTITISGLGFGTHCSACQVLAYPGPVLLAVSSWVDSSITAVLPPTFNGFSQILVQAVAGQDFINVMTSPLATTSTITFQTSPAGLQFSVDGASPLTAPQTLSLANGVAHTISVPTLQAGTSGTQYSFTSWSDGGVAAHSINVTAAATYTAAFQTQYQLTTSASPSAGGSVIPGSGGFYNAGSVVPVSASPNTGYSFTGWTGNVANASTGSTTVTMSAPEAVAANFTAIVPVSLTIQTKPSGLQLSVDGGMPLAAPQTLSLTKGSTHTITAITPQSGGMGTQYVFTSWSDGGAASHTVTASASGSLTATFQTQYQLTLSASPAAGGTVTPASGAFYNSGAAVPITAAANSGYMFMGWTGNVASTSALSTTITMGSPQAVTAIFASTAPTINTGGIVPLYSSVPLIQPGSWISIYGNNLANSTAIWDGSFPTSLGGVSVMIDNKPGYLWLVSPGQINLQAPDDPATGPVNVTVTTPNGTVNSTVTLAAFGPSFSLLSAKYAAGVILTPNGSGAYDGGAYDLLGASGAFSFNTRPVKAGETLELYGVGFGPTNPHVSAGSAYSGAAPTLNTVTVTIGGVPAFVLFSGITSTGLYQFNIVVPSAGTGDQLLQASVNGVQTPGGVYVTVQ